MCDEQDTPSLMMAISGDYAVSCSYQFSRDELHNKEEIVE
jgi:hypothetical protein